MKATVLWKDAGCDLACGYGVRITYILRTFDKTEFDKAIQILKENVGDALTFDLELCAATTKEGVNNANIN